MLTFVRTAWRKVDATPMSYFSDVAFLFWEAQAFSGFLCFPRIYVRRRKPILPDVSSKAKTTIWVRAYPFYHRGGGGGGGVAWEGWGNFTCSS